MISIVLSILSITISIFTMFVYLFQSYRDVFTIYWFSEYDVIYMLPERAMHLSSEDIINSVFNEEKIKIRPCIFKHSFVGDIYKRYFESSIEEYYHNDLSKNYLKKIFWFCEETGYYVRPMVTHRGKKNYKKWVKRIAKI